MPKRPSKPKHPRDLNQLAKAIVDKATWQPPAREPGYRLKANQNDGPTRQVVLASVRLTAATRTDGKRDKRTVDMGVHYLKR